MELLSRGEEGESLLEMLISEAEENGDGDRDEADENEESVGLRADINETGRFTGAQTKCLENGGDTVGQVAAKECHRYDVEK